MFKAPQRSLGFKSGEGEESALGRSRTGKKVDAEVVRAMRRQGGGMGLVNTSLRSRYSEVGLISSGNCGGERRLGVGGGMYI